MFFKIDYQGDTTTQISQSQQVQYQGKLRQVLMNLVGNSLKFTDQGGITIRVRTTPSSSSSSSSERTNINNSSSTVSMAVDTTIVYSILARDE